MTESRLNSIYIKWLKAKEESDKAWILFAEEKNRLDNKYYEELKAKTDKDFHNLKIKGTKGSYLTVREKEGRNALIISRNFNKESDRKYMEAVNSFEIEVDLVSEVIHKGQVHLAIRCERFGEKKPKIFYDYESFKKFVLKKDWITLKEIE